MLAIYAPVVRETAISFEEEPPAEATFRERVRATLGARPWLVCELGGEVAGYAYAGAHRERAAYRWSVEPSVYVDAGHRRRGVARALYGALLDVLAVQGYFNAYAGIALPNPASVALHEACGFVPVGVYRGAGYKHGRWHDVGWWQRTLCDDRAAVREPRPLAEVLATPAWDAAVRRGEAMLRPVPSPMSKEAAGPHPPH